MENLFFKLLDVEKVRQHIQDQKTGKIPYGEDLILIPHYSINIQSKYISGPAPQKLIKAGADMGDLLQSHWDELEEAIGETLEVNDYDDLIIPAKYPEAYVYIRHNRSGETWMIPIQDHEPLDILYHVEKWTYVNFSGDAEIDGELSRLDGDYTATIYTDGCPPDSAVCWTSAGFYLKQTT